jgi:hypothetical protein
LHFSLDSTFHPFSAFKHESDGRVIIAEFESFLLLNTYAPNMSWKEEENSFQRRQKVGHEDAGVCSTNRQTFDLVWRFERQVVDKCLFLSEEGWGKNSRDILARLLIVHDN